jgi:FdhE protein
MSLPITPGAPLARWVERHPSLTSIAQFQRLLEDVGSGRAPVRPDVARWGACADDPELEIPLLHRAGGLDLAREAGEDLAGLLEAVAAAPLPAGLAQDCREIRAVLQSATERGRALDWIVTRADPAPAVANPGLLRLLAWTALRWRLAAVVAGFEQSAGLERWRHGYCPTCGALPVMAQLVPHESGRQRRLCCGHCGTCWKFPRVGCPFCGNESSARVDVLEVEGEALRLDTCQECQGYLKTYEGAGEEALFLADWTTLHLDVLARERGCHRRGESLYDLDDDRPHS